MNRTIPLRTLCAVLAIAISTAACSGGDDKASNVITPSATSEPTETTASAPAVTEPEPELTFVTPGPSAPASATASASATPTAPVTPGRVFAFIKDVLPGGANTGKYAGEATYDEAQFLTGAGAKKAAAADKKQLEGDYYIRNENTRLRTVEFSTDGLEFLGSIGLTAQVESQRVSLEQLDAFLETELGQNTGFWITIAKIRNRLMITKIEEQYVP